MSVHFCSLLKKSSTCLLGLFTRDSFYFLWVICFLIWLKRTANMQMTGLELLSPLQALLEVLLFKHRCCHLCGGQLWSRQNWHFKIRTCCYVRGKKTRMTVIISKTNWEIKTVFWSKCEIWFSEPSEAQLHLWNFSSQHSSHSTSGWKSTEYSAGISWVCAALSAQLISCSLVVVWKFTCLPGQLFVLQCGKLRPWRIDSS